MDIVIRVAVLYGLLILGFRVLGKRELSQLSPFELVTLLLIAEIVSPALTAGEHSLTAAVFGAATLLLLTFINSALSYKSKIFKNVTEAMPSLLIARGRFVEDTLHKDRIRPDEVRSELHKSGLRTIDEVEWGFIEPDGKLTFLAYEDKERQPSEDQSPV